MAILSLKSSLLTLIMNGGRGRLRCRLLFESGNSLDTSGIQRAVTVAAVALLDLNLIAFVVRVAKGVHA